MTWPCQDRPALCLLPIMVHFELQVISWLSNVGAHVWPSARPGENMKVESVRWSVTDICSFSPSVVISLRCRLLGCLGWILGDSCSSSPIKSPSVSFSFEPLILPSVHSFVSELILCTMVLAAGLRWFENWRLFWWVLQFLHQLFVVLQLTLRLLFPYLLLHFNHHTSGFSLSDLALLSLSLCWFLLLCWCHSLSVASLLLPAHLSAAITVILASRVLSDRQLQQGWAGEVDLWCLSPAVSLRGNTTVLIWQDLGHGCRSARAVSS